MTLGVRGYCERSSEPKREVHRFRANPMPPASETLDVEELFARGRERALAAPSTREMGVEGAAGVGFLAVALAMAIGFSSPRPLEALPLAVLVGAYVVACRAKFDFADGYTVPTELVLVPMLFLLPTPVVPLVISFSWTLGRLLDYGTVIVRGTGGSFEPIPFIGEPLAFRNHITAG